MILRAPSSSDVNKDLRPKVSGPMANDRGHRPRPSRIKALGEQKRPCLFNLIGLGFSTNRKPVCDLLIICPIAIAYSMGQIIKSVCVCVSVCLSVCLSVCEHSHGRISWSIFTKIGTDIRTPKSKNEFVGGSISHHPFPYFAPQNSHFRTRGPENPCKY